MSERSGMNRRTALKVIAASAATMGAEACAPEGAVDDTTGEHERLSGFEPLPPSNPLAAGTFRDPDLLNPNAPWELVLTSDERRIVSALADLIIPADDRSPAASEVGVTDFIDEWVSAPYEGQRNDLVVICGGLTWLNREARARFSAEDFAALDETQMREICDPISYLPNTPESLQAQARFFDLFRDLVSTGFWTSEEGMEDLGFIGGVPLPSFDGPPPEVVQALGLTAEDLA